MKLDLRSLQDPASPIESARALVTESTARRSKEAHMATGDLEYYEHRLAQETDRAAGAPDEHLRSLHIAYAGLLRARIDALHAGTTDRGTSPGIRR